MVVMIMVIVVMMVVLIVDWCTCLLCSVTPVTCCTHGPAFIVLRHIVQHHLPRHVQQVQTTKRRLQNDDNHVYRYQNQVACLVRCMFDHLNIMLTLPTQLHGNVNKHIPPLSLPLLLHHSITQLQQHLRGVPQPLVKRLQPSPVNDPM